MLAASLSKSDQPSLTPPLRCSGRDVGPAGTPPAAPCVGLGGPASVSSSFSIFLLPLPHLFQPETFTGGVPVKRLKPSSLPWVHSIQGRGTQPRPPTAGEQIPSWLPFPGPSISSQPCPHPAQVQEAAREPAGLVNRPTNWGATLMWGVKVSPSPRPAPMGKGGPGFLHKLHLSKASFLCPWLISGGGGV